MQKKKLLMYIGIALSLVTIGSVAATIFFQFDKQFSITVTVNGYKYDIYDADTGGNPTEIVFSTNTVLEGLPTDTTLISDYFYLGPSSSPASVQANVYVTASGLPVGWTVEFQEQGPFPDSQPRVTDLSDGLQHLVKTFDEGRAERLYSRINLVVPSGSNAQTVDIDITFDISDNGV